MGLTIWLGLPWLGPHVQQACPPKWLWAKDARPSVQDTGDRPGQESSFDLY